MRYAIAQNRCLHCCIFKSLVFGVEIFELKYDINNQKFAMSTINEAMGLRGEVQKRPSFIGDHTEGDVFIVLSNY
jgi:hypothetical protein